MTDPIEQHENQSEFEKQAVRHETEDYHPGG